MAEEPTRPMTKVEAAVQFLDYCVEVRKRFTSAEQSFQLTDEEKIELTDRIIKDDYKLTRLADQFERIDA